MSLILKYGTKSVILVNGTSTETKIIETLLSITSQMFSKKFPDWLLILYFTVRHNTTLTILGRNSLQINRRQKTLNF